MNPATLKTRPFARAQVNGHVGEGGAQVAARHVGEQQLGAAVVVEADRLWGGARAQSATRTTTTTTTSASSTSSGMVSKTRRSGIAKMFEKVVGKAQFAALRASFSSKPVVLIAGDQLTGKSTAAATVAKLLGGEASGTGRLMRAAAAEKHLAVEEFVKTVPAGFDVELDWLAAKKIGKGEVSVFESRLAGHLGQVLQELGRKNVVSVYLTASPRERALRYLSRELSPAVRARIEPQLKIAGDATLEEAMAAIVALGDPEASKLAASMKDIAHRDDVDHTRLRKLYDVDYQDRSSFDVVIVTDGKTPAEVQAEIAQAAKAQAA